MSASVFTSIVTSIPFPFRFNKQNRLVLMDFPLGFLSNCGFWHSSWHIGGIFKAYCQVLTTIQIIGAMQLCLWAFCSLSGLEPVTCCSQVAHRSDCPAPNKFITKPLDIYIKEPFCIKYCPTYQRYSYLLSGVPIFSSALLNQRPSCEGSQIPWCPLVTAPGSLWCLNIGLWTKARGL